MEKRAFWLLSSSDTGTMGTTIDDVDFMAQMQRMGVRSKYPILIYSNSIFELEFQIKKIAKYAPLFTKNVLWLASFSKTLKIQKQLKIWKWRLNQN